MCSNLREREYGCCVDDERCDVSEAVIDSGDGENVGNILRLFYAVRSLHYAWYNRIYLRLQ